MTKNIHPIIKKLNISNKAKAYFNKLEFYEIIEDPIILSTHDNQRNEATENRWSFKVDRNLKYYKKEELKTFYKAIISSRAQYLVTNHPSVNMIFYTWYDDMSGNFYFSLISAIKSLPFGCTVNKVDFLDDIIQEFIDGPYKGVIPMNELIDVTNVVEEDEEDDIKKYILNVWSVILPENINRI